MLLDAQCPSCAALGRCVSHGNPNDTFSSHVSTLTTSMNIKEALRLRCNVGTNTGVVSPSSFPCRVANGTPGHEDQRQQRRNAVSCVPHCADGRAIDVASPIHSA